MEHKEYHHIVATIQKDQTGIKWLITSVANVPSLKKGDIVMVVDDGKTKAIECTDINPVYYEFGFCMIPKSQISKEALYAICHEDSAHLSNAFKQKLKTLEHGTQVLIQTEDDDMTLKTRKDGTYIIHPYTREAKFYDCLHDVKESLETGAYDIEALKRYIEEVLDSNEIEYY